MPKSDQSQQETQKKRNSRTAKLYAPYSCSLLAGTEHAGSGTYLKEIFRLDTVLTVTGFLLVQLLRFLESFKSQ